MTPGIGESGSCSSTVGRPCLVPARQLPLQEPLGLAHLPAQAWGDKRLFWARGGCPSRPLWPRTRMPCSQISSAKSRTVPPCPPALAKSPAQPSALMWSPPADSSHCPTLSPQQDWGLGLPGTEGFPGRQVIWYKNLDSPR